MKAQYPIPTELLLRLDGADVGDLLHRISASEVRDLEPGSCRRLLFCDDKGRVVDLPLARREESQWWLLASEGNSEALADWIERYVITEEVSVDRAPAHGWALQVDQGSETLQPQSSASGDPSELHAYRIQAGLYLPRDAAALKLHPLECGLRRWISFDKGCYIGQEVVARMDSYAKIQRALHWLRGPGTAPGSGATLSRDGKVLGRVLDACALGEGYLALAQLAVQAEIEQSMDVEGAEPGRAERVPDSDA